MADKFHVLRLLNHHIIRRRKEITGDRASWRARSLLLCSNKNLDYFQRKVLWEYLEAFLNLKRSILLKKAFTHFTESKAKQSRKGAHQTHRSHGELKIKRNKNTQENSHEMASRSLNYFKTGITNARTEGFNNIAKLLQRNALGLKALKTID